MRRTFPLSAKKLPRKQRATFVSQKAPIVSKEAPKLTCQQRSSTASRKLLTVSRKAASQDITRGKPLGGRFEYFLIFFLLGGGGVGVRGAKKGRASVFVLKIPEGGGSPTRVVGVSKGNTIRGNKTERF